LLGYIGIKESVLNQLIYEQSMFLAHSRERDGKLFKWRIL